MRTTPIAPKSLAWLSLENHRPSEAAQAIDQFGLGGRKAGDVVAIAATATPSEVAKLAANLRALAKDLEEQAASSQRSTGTLEGLLGLNFVDFYHLGETRAAELPAKMQKNQVTARELQAVGETFVCAALERGDLKSAQLFIAAFPADGSGGLSFDPNAIPAKALEKAHAGLRKSALGYISAATSRSEYRGDEDVFRGVATARALIDLGVMPEAELKGAVLAGIRRHNLEPAYLQKHFDDEFPALAQDPWFRQVATGPGGIA